MKKFTLIDIAGTPCLRENNPLTGLPGYLSPAAHEEHERQYLAEALPLIIGNAGQTEYEEHELDIAYQYKPFGTEHWVDIHQAETELIEISGVPVRHVYKVTSKFPNEYQQKVNNWIVETFGSDKAQNVRERSLRFLEEAIELGQSLELTIEETQRLVVWVFGRHKGDPAQELGGVMLTVAGLANCYKLDMLAEAETELTRVLNRNKVEILEKHNLKVQNNITA